MKALRATCAAAMFVGIAMATPPAWADATAAEAFFKEGLAAMKREDFPTACEAFSKSNNEDPSPGTQINLAICFEKQKKWASAWTWYRAAAGLAQQRKQEARETSANDSAKRIEPNLHHIGIVVKNGTPDMQVRRDNLEKPITITLAGKPLPLPLDPGEHTIEVKAPTRKTLTKTITIADTPVPESKPEIIELTLEDAPFDPTANLETAPGTKTIIRTENDGSTQRTLGFVAGGAAILTGLAAIGVYALAKGEESKREEQEKVYRNTALDKPTRDAAAASANTRNDAAQNNQLIAIILASGAGVMAGLGVVLYLTAPKPKEKAAATKIIPTPIAGPTFQGLGFVGTF